MGTVAKPNWLFCIGWGIGYGVGCGLQRPNLQPEYAAAFAGEGQIVGHEDGGEAALTAQIGQQAEDHFAGAGVQVSGGLIGQKEGGATHQRTGDSNALLFSAGKFAGAMMGTGGEAHFIKATAGVGLRPRFGNAADQQGHHDVFESREFRKQMMLLPDVADFPVAEDGEGGFGEAGDVTVFVENVSAGGVVEARNEVEKGAFPSPAGADDGDLVSGTDMQIQIAKDNEVGIARAVDFSEPVNANEGIRDGHAGID